MATLAAPTALSAVSLDSPSPGAHIEIRSAATADTPLAQTRLLAAGTVTDDHLDLALPPAPPTTHLLIWITALSRQSDGYQATLSEVTLHTQT